MRPGAVPADREPVDLRLALGALAAWLATLALLDARTSVVLALGLGGGLGGTALLVAVRGAARSWVPVVALAALCCALVLLPLAARLAHARASPMTALAARHASVTVEVVTSGDPRVLSGKGPAGAPRVAVDATARAVLDGGRRTSVDGRVLLLGDASDWRDVLPGTPMRVDAVVQPDLGGSALSVTLLERGSPQQLGDPPWWQRAAGTVRSSLRSAAAVLPAQERGLLPGLVEGDTSNLDPVLAAHFRAAGLTHLTAVSGTNCAIVVGAVLLLLRRGRVRPVPCAVVGAIVLVVFVVVARPSPSVLRAAVTAAIALAALAAGRPRAAVPTLSGAVLLLLLWDPTLARSASFAMSALATGGLLLLAPGWAAALHRRRVPSGLAEGVAVATACHLVTAPVVVALSGQVGVVAVVANVLAEPAVAVTTVLGFLAAVLAPLWLPAGQVAAWSAGWPCRWLVAVADRLGSLEGATLPWPGGTAGALALAALLAGLVLLSRWAGAGRVLVASAVTALVVLVPVRSVSSGWPPDGWVFAACDVGQGDALVLDAGHGAGVLVDAGPDPVPVDRCLRGLGITSLPLVVLSHLHLDHVGGLPGAVRGRPVGAVLAGPLPDPVGGLDIVRQVLDPRGRVARTPLPGAHLTVGAVSLDVLGPAASFHGTRSDPNNSSLVLRAVVSGTRVLLPGDAEVEAQQRLLAAGVDLRADVLKVPHHGSAYSDPDFLAAAHASLAVVSVGAHNDYGHPSPVLLHELAALGVPLFRTDRDGDVAVTRAGGTLRAVVHGRAVGTTAARVPGPLFGPLTMAAAVSGPGARMAPCPRARCPSTTCPCRCPRWSSSSATRSCWSSGPSPRSPPPRHGPTRPSW